MNQGSGIGDQESEVGGGKPALTVLDTFAGIGGFSLGLERTGGFRTVGFIEIDPFCRRVLAKHWPEVPQHDDIRTYPFRGGEADVVTGGFPCQDISVAGSRAGLAGADSGLWRELLRAIRMVRPRYAIVENVAALCDRGMGTVLGDLAETDYDAEVDCISACELGAPHTRERMFIVAYPKSHLGEEWLGLHARIARALQQGDDESGAGAWLDMPADSGGMALGLPAQLDRLRSLGNAVVPRKPELIGRAILAAEAEAKRRAAA